MYLMFNYKYFQLKVALTLALLLAACTTTPPPAPTETPVNAATAAQVEAPGDAPTTAPSAATNAADYCVEKGGRVITRHATYGIYNDPTEWLRLNGERQFCEFLEAPDGGEDGVRSRISLDLATLWSTAPTLAALAYYEPPPPPAPEPGVKLAFVYCAQLGGTAYFGGQDNPAGGSWATAEGNSAENEQLIDHCLFPDQSAIAQTGLYDNANGTIDGLDLRTVLRYRPAQLPQIYPGGEPRETTAPGVPALPEAPNGVPEPNPDAAAYCEAQGGQVLLRTFFYGTNGNRSQWLQLGTPAHFCEFDAQPETTADADSRIAVGLETLYSEEPTLAALAYLEPPPMGEVPAGVNPAPVYCSQLGGSSSPTGPDNTAGGGWVNEAEPVFVVMAVCVFPDGSMMDEWGLTYHSDGAIRGADLSSILRYQPETVPDVFVKGRPAFDGREVAVTLGK
jgi:putative hemolysin